MKLCQDIIKCLQTEPDLLHRVIISNGTWTLKYDPGNQAAEQTVGMDITEATENKNIKVCGCARGVMVIVVGNGHGDSSSNPGRD